MYARLVLIASVLALTGCTPAPQRFVAPAPQAEEPQPVEKPVTIQKTNNDQPPLQNPADPDTELNEPLEYHANAPDSPLVIEK